MPDDPKLPVPSQPCKGEDESPGANDGKRGIVVVGYWPLAIGYPRERAPGIMSQHFILNLPWHPDGGALTVNEAAPGFYPD